MALVPNINFGNSSLRSSLPLTLISALPTSFTSMRFFPPPGSSGPFQTSIFLTSFHIVCDGVE